MSVTNSLGKVMIIHKGEYNASTTYAILDVASYLGASYVALKSVTGVTPTADGVNWQLMSAKGDQVNPRGAYQADATYNVLDIVTYLGSSYLALKTVTGVTPADDEVNWQPIADKGDKGDPGEYELLIDDTQALSDKTYSSLKIYTDVNKKADQLKVANIEKSLNDYAKLMSQVNINQEAKQTEIGYANILSLPKNAANAPTNVSFSGMTLNNKLINCDFANGTNDWVSDSSTISVANQVLSITGGSVSAYANAYGRTTLKSVEGDKIFVAARFRVTNADCLAIYAQRYTNTGENLGSLTLKSSPNENIWYCVGKSTTLSSDADGSNIKLYLKHEYVDSLTAEGKVMEVDGKTGVFEINMTALGLTSLTDEEMLELVQNGAFSGFGSVNARGRIRSFSTNLFNGNVNNEYPDWAVINKISKSSFSMKAISVTGIGEFNVFPDLIFEENTQYTFSGSHVEDIDEKNGRLRIIYSDGTTQSFPAPTTSKASFETTSTVDKTISLISYTFSASQGTTMYENFMITKSTTALPYEPYVESVKYINSNEKLRRLPNDVADEIRQKANGSYEHVKRIKAYELLASDITATANGVNVQYVFIDKNSNFVGDGNVTSENSFILDGFTTDTFETWDDVNNINKISAQVSDSEFVLVVEKNTYTDLTEAKTTLTGIEMLYQLETPITTQVATSGTLVSYPNGTMYFESITSDYGYYTTNMVVAETDFPISELKSLSKFNIDDGTETKLDETTAVIASDGLSFTHPDLADGDIVFFEYEFDVAGVAGNKTVEFYDSRYVIEDTNNGKFYQWGITSTDGVPSIGLEEV